MKKAARFLKQLFSAIVAAVRERSPAARARTGAARTRLVFFGILRNKKLLRDAINSKIHAIVGGGSGSGQQLVAASGGGSRTVAVLEKLPSFVADQGRRAAVLLNSLPSFAMGREGGTGSPLVGGGEDEKEEADEGVKKQLQLASAQPGSVIELARGAAERGGAEFRLEDEIDHVADVFIRRFHDQMKLQKLESFKRFCEMLERN
ncbi:hypothetical protein D1007_40895 [Hordeum vulgare]|nr:hypothetical protein D1007_40895 [Hordeum vulgare]